MSALSDLMQAIQACWCEALEDSLGGPPAECCWVAGDPVVAECCGGYAWVRFVSSYPTLDFPAQDAEARRCPLNTFAAVIELGISRCAPSSCGNTENSCCESELDAALILLDDYARARFALQCCVPLPGDAVIVGNWTTQGPQGGCLTGVLSATIRFDEEPLPVVEP